MLILLWNLLLYAGVGCLEWYLALRRTLACARGEKALMVSLVFAENLLGLWVLVNFVRTSDWLIAIVYSLGASLGALLVSGKGAGEAAPQETRPETRRAPFFAGEMKISWTKPSFIDEGFDEELLRPALPGPRLKLSRPQKGKLSSRRVRSRAPLRGGLQGDIGGRLPSLKP